MGDECADDRSLDELDPADLIAQTDAARRIARRRTTNHVEPTRQDLDSVRRLLARGVKKGALRVVFQDGKQCFLAGELVQLLLRSRSKKNRSIALIADSQFPTKSIASSDQIGFFLSMPVGFLSMGILPSDQDEIREKAGKLWQENVILKLQLEAALKSREDADKVIKQMQPVVEQTDQRRLQNRKNAAIRHPKG